MSEFQTIKGRLIAFVKGKGMGQGAFEKHVGLSNGYINNIRVSIQPDKLQKIALCFPDLNTGWLMTGEGEMLKESTNHKTPPPLSIESAPVERTDRMLALLEKQSSQLETLINTNQELSKVNKKMADKIIEFVEQGKGRTQEASDSDTVISHT